MVDKPTTVDIMVAVANLKAGGPWVDPLYDPLFWSCNIYAPGAGPNDFTDGCGWTRAEAAAMAWINAHAPDWMAGIGLDEVPLIVPEGWRFELFPPLLNATEEQRCMRRYKGDGLT